ncbi:MAG: hypothetical protein J5702_00830 [Bacteroidales bacterium]|nr:hypothetical protein [Bacteroidales bacterium]
MEGLEKSILCRDEQDYDAMVKILAVCARRKNVLIIVYAVVSNHSHVAVLAAGHKEADAFGQEAKRMYSMWFTRRYGEQRILRKTDVKAIALDSDWYIRNALAYILRNALDNGYNVNEYQWSGYRAMFGTGDKKEAAGRSVAKLTKMERRSLMHTGDKLDDVRWQLDSEGRLLPSSICDHEYLEQAFEHDQAFFLKTIGGQNAAEMKQKLVDNPRTMLPDSEFFKAANETALRWFQADLSQLSLNQKARIIPYIRRTMHTTIPQLARTFGLKRDAIAKILGRKTSGTF